MALIQKTSDNIQRVWKATTLQNKVLRFDLKVC
mgnify:CR=1 FL=1